MEISVWRLFDEDVGYDVATKKKTTSCRKLVDEVSTAGNDTVDKHTFMKRVVILL